MERRAGSPFDLQTLGHFAQQVLRINYGSARVPATLWTKGQQLLCKTWLKSADQQGESIVYLAFPADPELQKFYDECESKGIDRIFLRLNLPSDAYFLLIEPRRATRDRLMFRVMDRIYRLQRRRTFRLPLPENWLVRGKWKGKEFKILDLSTGGMRAMGLSEDAADGLTPGQRLEGFEFKLKGRVYTVDVEVRHQMQVSSSRYRKSTKLGLMFTRISEDDRALMSAQLLEEYRKYYGRAM